MTQTPAVPIQMPNLEFVEAYMDCLESLPLEIQRLISQIREYDIIYRKKLQQISKVMNLHSDEESKEERKKLLNKLQKYLVKSQQYADEKLYLISQMLDLVESRNQNLFLGAESADAGRKDEVLVKNSTNQQMKIEKQTKISQIVEKEKPIKGSYDKPKRPRRSKVPEKAPERVEKSLRSTKEENEEEEIEEIEDEEPKIKNNNKKKEKYKVKDEDKRADKKTPAKIVKKPNKQAAKNKKRKKEKELSTEEMTVDPDEPTYCLCSSISYGDMIGCDNDDCVIEWFHFGCVNLSHKPKGKWYCPSCTADRKNKR